MPHLIVPYKDMNDMILLARESAQLDDMNQFYERQSRSLEREDQMNKPYFSGRAHKEELYGITKNILKPHQSSTPILPRVYNHLNV